MIDRKTRLSILFSWALPGPRYGTAAQCVGNWGAWSWWPLRALAADEDMDETWIYPWNDDDEDFRNDDDDDDDDDEVWGCLIMRNSIGRVERGISPPCQTLMASVAIAKARKGFRQQVGVCIKPMDFDGLEIHHWWI